MNATRTKKPEPDRDQLVIEFAKAALTGSLMDPNVNPRNPQALEQTVDFIWLIARTMVERQPPPPRKLQ